MAYKIKNWEKFQHYKSGRGAPPWIKLYRELLNDKEWHRLDPSAAKILISCWILAAEDSGNLPDIDTIAFRLRVDSKVIAKSLNQCNHWIIPNEINNDSKPLSSCYQVATPETETETETETENTLSGSPDIMPPKKESKPSLATEILIFLNDKTGKNYRPVKANIGLIDARLKEYEFQDLKSMIAMKCRQWRDDPVMNQYMRPATLFNATKCAQYIGELHHGN